MKVNIRYKSIIKYEEHQETIEYQEIGEYLDTEAGFALKFVSGGNRIGIEQNGDRIYLTNNESTLVLGSMQLLNDYQTPYGAIELVSEMSMFQFRKPNLKIKYTLCKDDVKISDIFIVVNIKEGDGMSENIQNFN